MHATFIPVQAAERDNVDEIYRAIDWFIGGSYAAELAILRGYRLRMDLGLAYAGEQLAGGQDRPGRGEHREGRDQVLEPELLIGGARRSRHPRCRDARFRNA